MPELNKINSIKGLAELLDEEPTGALVGGKMTCGVHEPGKQEFSRKIYVAASLSKGPWIRDHLAEFLTVECGFKITVPWWDLPDLRKNATLEDLENRAYLDLYTGVMNADLVLVILPGGRGTNFEFGAAVAAEKPVILYDGLIDPNEVEYPSVFWELARTTRANTLKELKLMLATFAMARRGK